MWVHCVFNYQKKKKSSWCIYKIIRFLKEIKKKKVKIKRLRLKIYYYIRECE